MKKLVKDIGIWIIMFAVAYIGYSYFMGGEETPEIMYSDLISSIKNEQVETIVISDNKIYAKIDGVECESLIPSVDALYDDAGDDREEQYQKSAFTHNSTLTLPEVFLRLISGNIIRQERIVNG